jgi:hypothetical protein
MLTGILFVGCVCCYWLVTGMVAWGYRAMGGFRTPHTEHSRQAKRFICLTLGAGPHAAHRIQSKTRFA